MPTCTVIKTGAIVSVAASERVTELKELIDSVQVPAFPGHAGDIVFYDNVAEEKTIIPYSTWSANPSKYPSSQYTPIGVVVVPKNHNVYNSGECAMVSLKYMNYSTPDEGSTSSQNMYWGEYNTDTDLPNLSEAVTVGTSGSQYTTAQNTNSYSYLPSDNFSDSYPECLTDPETHYYSSSCTAAPSPYLEDGSRNPVYYQTESPSSELNCLADFEGLSNTNYLISLATGQSGWQTASSITNNSGAGYTPAACCCWRYHTDGTEQGDWYLPAEGELGYMMVRLKTINNVIQALIDTYGSAVASTIGTSNSFWSSTEYSAAIARSVDTYNGSVDYYGKNTNHVVRAFCRV